MQILKPIVHETIWGGSLLTPCSGSECTSIGHLYSAIDTPAFNNRIAGGSYAGRTLHAWFADNKARYGLERYAELPILMALVEARQNLSIQVHPNDAMARRLEGLPFGKNESFYTLKAPDCGRMYNGCKASSVEEMREMIAAGRIAETLDMMPCKAGDYVYITGGTLHAATAGGLHFEIEENCEKTYRFYDFDRVDGNGQKRPLQLEKALACLDVSQKSVSRRYDGAPIEERMYITQLIRQQDSLVNERDMFAFAVLLRGEKSVLGISVLPGTAVLLEPGETLDVSGCEVMLVWPKR